MNNFLLNYGLLLYILCSMVHRKQAQDILTREHIQKFFGNRYNIVILDNINIRVYMKQNYQCQIREWLCNWSVGSGTPPCFGKTFSNTSIGMTR